jgi:Ni/Co efflux regulator RcnB
LIALPESGVRKLLESKMKLKTVACTLIAASLAATGIALAEENGNHNDRGTQIAQRDDHGERGAGPNHQYHKGDRLPEAEHRKENVVNDWHSRNLREPPSGYHWVKSGDDFVLAAVATGIIADLVLSH